MSVVDPSPVQSSPLVARIKAILLTPGPEWDKIDTEPATVQGLYTGYICILAAIPVVAKLIHSLVFGYGFFFVSYHPTLASAITSAVTDYVLSLASVFILALIIDALAPSFGGQKSQIQAFKVAAYANTAAWVAGALFVVPGIGGLAILGGLYSLYLLFIGLPKLMKAPEDKALVYTAVTILVAIVLYAIVGSIAGRAMVWSGNSYVADGGHVSGVINVPGGSVDLGKLDAASKSIEATNRQIQAQQAGAAAPAGAITAVSGDALKALLPASLSGGLARSETSSSSANVGGVGGSEAEGSYSQGADKRITLKVADMGAMGALASLGGAVKVNSSKETATGYEKVSTVNGRMTEEDYDTSTKSGKYSVVVGTRFLVEANGDGVSMDELKGAVGAVNASALEGMAKG